MKKEILSFKIVHKDTERDYFNFDLSMIWCLLKYKLKGKKISMTVTKSFDREEYRIQFLIN